MKRIITLASLALFASMAHATYCDDGSLIASHPNGDCSQPIAAPSTKQHQGQHQSQHQAQQQKQGQQQTASGGAGGQGGSSTSSSSVNAPSTATSSSQGSTNTLGAIGNDNSSSSFKALALSLPAAPFTPPLPMSDGNCSDTTQDAWAAGWNFAGKASAHQSTDNCVLIKLHNAYLSECQYASAKQLKDLLTAKLLPGFKASDNGMVDLATDACRALLAPIPPAPPTVVNFVAAAPTPAPAPKACTPAKKIAKKTPRDLCARKTP